MQLYIGNKNYSSWSLRPWLVMTHTGIPFEEVALRFDDFAADGAFRREIARVNPAGKVPVLVVRQAHDARSPSTSSVDGDLSVWDTLAIAEYLNERFPDKQLWPRDVKQRALARSVCAEMHSGFQALRGAFPMNIEASLPEIGQRMLAENKDAKANLDRIVQLWTDALTRSGGPFLFGEFSIADGYFAPVVSRIKTHALPVPEQAAAYCQRIQALPAMQAWTAAALAEHDWVADDEPYRTKPA